jgi:hypothetical protein
MRHMMRAAIEQVITAALRHRPIRKCRRQCRPVSKHVILLNDVKERYPFHLAEQTVGVVAVRRVIVDAVVRHLPRPMRAFHAIGQIDNVAALIEMVLECSLMRIVTPPRQDHRSGCAPWP